MSAVMKDNMMEAPPCGYCGKKVEHGQPMYLLGSEWACADCLLAWNAEKNRQLREMIDKGKQNGKA